MSKLLLNDQYLSGQSNWWRILPHYCSRSESKEEAFRSLNVFSHSSVTTTCHVRISGRYSISPTMVRADCRNGTIANVCWHTLISRRILSGYDFNVVRKLSEHDLLLGYCSAINNGTFCCQSLFRLFTHIFLLVVFIGANTFRKFEARVGSHLKSE